jgi:hypothetical protein
MVTLNTERKSFISEASEISQIRCFLETEVGNLPKERASLKFKPPEN